MTSGDERRRGGTEFVASAERTLAVLNAFDADNRRITLTEVAQRTALTRGTARRFLLTLQSLEYVDSDGKLFWLTPKVLGLANAYLTSFGIGDAAKEVVRRVAKEVNESSSVGVLQGGDVVYVARADAPRRFATAFSLHIGSKVPAHCTSMGRVLLAAMDSDTLSHWLARYPLFAINERTIVDEAKWHATIEEVRRNDYAISDGEMEVGLRSIAVPVRDSSGRVVAGLNAATNSARTSLSVLRKTFLPIMRAAAAEIGETMRHH